ECGAQRGGAGRGRRGPGGRGAGTGGRVAQGEERPPGGFREGPQDRQRQGEPARLLPDGLRRLPGDVRPRGGVGGGHRRRHPPRGGRPARAGEPDRHRARAGALRASRPRGAAGGGRRLVRALAVATLLALSTLARAADEVTIPPITRATLDNGLRVVVAEYPELA